ncbi:MAG TPA: response regulator transcription factor [Spirochaetia bacterium]|nr:response regulator transcription factor [Spirochaetia bacterium]
MGNIRLLIVDDHAMIREGLVVMLKPYRDIEVVGTCTGGAEAAEAAGRYQPDVILMDIKMGGVSGIEATSGIVANWPRTKVICLTIYEDAESVRMALQAGATGYMLKQASQEKLVECIQRVYRGDIVIDPSLMGQLVNDYTRLAQGVAKNRPSPVGDGQELTPREEEVLNYLSLGLTNKEISCRTHLAVDTVKTHLRNIYRKMGVKNRSQAITEIMRQRGRMV